MKRNKIMLLVMLVLLSGCTTHERLIKDYQKFITEIQSENYFDASKFSQSGTGCLGEDLLCELFPDKSYGVKYVPEAEYLLSDAGDDVSVTSEYDYLFLSSMGANKKEFDNISVASIYLQKYIFNDYIFDEEQGNYLIDFFQKLDENNIHYYIHANTDIEEGYFFFEDEDIVWIFENQSVYCDVNKYQTDDEIKEYLGNQNLEELDLLNFLEYLNCDAKLVISFDKDNLKEQGVSLEQIEMLSKQYYNPEHITLDIRELVYPYEINCPTIWYMDSEIEYSISHREALAVTSSPPRYNW